MGPPIAPDLDALVSGFSDKHGKKHRFLIALAATAGKTPAPAKGRSLLDRRFRNSQGSPSPHETSMITGVPLVS
jgi:hypothetical protein